MNFRSGKALIISTTVFVVIIASAAAYAIFLNKTPKELYFSAETKTFVNTIQEIKDKYKDDLAVQNAMAQGPSRTNLELSGDIKIDGLMSESERDQLETI